MVVGTLPVWPPPSPPWMVTASTPISTIFCACFTAPTVGMQTMPASRNRLIMALSGPRPKLTARTFSAMMVSTISAAPGWNMWKFTPNGLSVSSRTRRMAGPTSSAGKVAAARKPKAPALQDAATSSGRATQPMAVCTMG